MRESFYDRLVEALIWFALLFGPWAFGTTENWSIQLMTAVGWGLGLLWMGRLVVRRWASRRSATVAKKNPASRGRKLPERLFRQTLLVLTALILGYCLLSAANARAVHHLWSLEYRDCFLWLPHSYDRDRSWAVWGSGLSLAGFFWCGRDWLLRQGGERSRLPARLRRLLWILTANGGLLAVVSLVQHFSGENKLLWLVEPAINKTAATQFGPFAYHANGAQYFNLLWPVGLAFWVYLKRRPVPSPDGWWGRWRLKVLLVCVLLMALCPLVSLSRGGALIALLNGGVAAGLVWLSFRRRLPGFGWRVALVAGGILLIGGLAEGAHLLARFQAQDYSDQGRFDLYATGWQMALDNQPFGCGPGAYDTLVQLYVPDFQASWVVQLHNDWLEIVLTLGVVGLLLLLSPLLLIAGRHRFAGGIRLNWPVVGLFWVAVVGCLLHALVDFPFRVHSILLLFVFICCVLSTVSGRATHPRKSHAP